MLPREHGSWAILVAPPVLGWAAAGGGPAGAGVFFAMGLLGAFLLRTPLGAPTEAGARRWSAAYALLAAAGFGGLGLAYGRWRLSVLGLPGAAALGVTLWNQARRRGMREANELVGIAGLCLGAPAAWFAASGRWEPGAARLWALCALYFAGPVFHVRMLVTRRIAMAPGAPVAARGKADAARLGSLVAHAGALAAVAAAGRARLVPDWSVLPFALALAKTAWWGRYQPPRLELKKVGWQELGWTCVFVVLNLRGYAA